MSSKAWSAFICAAFDRSWFEGIEMVRCCSYYWKAPEQAGKEE